MTQLKRDFGAQVKSANDETGEVEALVATYDVDSVGDKIIPGAFEKTLKDWKDSGDNIPWIWSHKHDDLNAYLGEIVDAKETKDGLLVKAKHDMDHPDSKRAFDLMKSGRIKNFSFAYEVKDGEFVDETVDEDKGLKAQYFALKELKLFEAGPCLIGANQNTRLLGAKRADVITEVKGEDFSDAKVYVEIDDLAMMRDILEDAGYKCIPPTDDNSDSAKGTPEERSGDKSNVKSALLRIDLMEFDN
jgi:HK97 family phage prohead protease